MLGWSAKTKYFIVRIGDGIIDTEIKKIKLT